MVVFVIFFLFLFSAEAFSGCSSSKASDVAKTIPDEVASEVPFHGRRLPLPLEQRVDDERASSQRSRISFDVSDDERFVAPRDRHSGFSKVGLPPRCPTNADSGIRKVLIKNQEERDCEKGKDSMNDTIYARESQLSMANYSGGNGMGSKNAQEEYSSFFREGF